MVFKNHLTIIIVAIFPLAMICAIADAQVVIGTNTSMASGDNTDIVINSTGNLVNNTAFDFAKTNLNVDLSESASIISGNWNMKRFRLRTASTVNLSGNLTVNQRFDLSS